MSKTTWRSPSNIALIKYWGKRGIQLPMNPSLSISLSKAYTETSVDYKKKETSDGNINFNFYFENQKNLEFEARISKLFRIAGSYFPYLPGVELEIHSHNSFPHSSGIASSASSMSALALCLCSVELEVYGRTYGFPNFFEKASYIARLASGSACRSVYGGYVTWGNTTLFEHASDEAAMQLPITIAPEFDSICDSILIVSSKAKKVSSTTGHEFMETNPYAGIRYREAIRNYRELVDALEKGKERAFIKIVETEALGLHAMFLTSNPGYFLVESETLIIIEKIRQFRETTGCFVCFTLDAGPNVHLLYKKCDADKIKEFIKSELLQHCENDNFIDDEVGTGPVKIE